MTLIDTNVLLDLVTDDPDWADWSVARLEAASVPGPLLIDARLVRTVQYAALFFTILLSLKKRRYTFLKK